MRSNFKFEEHILTTDAKTFFERLRRWSQSETVWPLIFGSGFSAIEFSNLFGSRYDIEKLGLEGICYSPPQADLLIVTGPVTQKMYPILKNIYDNMCEPRWVMALGSEAISGGLFQNYTLKKDWEKEIPVDIKIPGDPPTPESIMTGINLLKERISKGVRSEMKSSFTKEAEV